MIVGVSKQWIVDERFPSCTLRTALTYFLDIASTVTQNILMYFSTQTTNEKEKFELEKLAKVSFKFKFLFIIIFKIY